MYPAHGEPAKYTKEDKLYLKSIRHQPSIETHPNIVNIREENKKLVTSTSSIYGHCWWSSVNKIAIDYLRSNYETQSNDVFITSFPRSGTHFLMKICLEIMRNCHLNINELPPEYKNADYRYIPQIEPMVGKYDGIKIFNQFINRYNKKYKTLRFNFSHCPYYLFPAKNINKKTKIIHIVRNPKDTLSSIYNMHIDINKAFNSNKYIVENMKKYIKFQDKFDDFINGIISGGDWWCNLIEWYLASKDIENNNILFIYYED